MLKHFSRVVTAFKSRRAQAQAWTLRGGVGRVRNDDHGQSLFWHGSVCKRQSTLRVIVLSKSFAGVNNHRNSHCKRYIREHDHLVMYLPLQTSISLFSHQNTTLNTPHVTPRHADSLTAFLT